MPIKDVKEGDVILSFDETTGKMVPTVVEKLIDKGIQEVFTITTESGKTITTTKEHPYLVDDSDKETDLNILQKCSFEFTEKRARQFYFRTFAGSSVYSPALRERIRFTAEGWNHFVEKSRSLNELITRFFALPRVAIVIAHAKDVIDYEKRVKADIAIEYWMFTEVVDHVLVRVVVCSINGGPKFFLSCNWLGTKEKEGIKPSKKELSLSPQNEKSSILGRRRRLGTSQLFNSLTVPQDRKNVKWTKVKDLSVGRTIATLDGWERIASIRKAGRKHVYDISIFGTRNFVGNGIVAHNTAAPPLSPVQPIYNIASGLDAWRQAVREREALTREGEEEGRQKQAVSRAKERLPRQWPLTLWEYHAIQEASTIADLRAAVAAIRARIAEEARRKEAPSIAQEPQAPRPPPPSKQLTLDEALRQYEEDEAYQAYERARRETVEQETDAAYLQRGLEILENAKEEIRRVYPQLTFDEWQRLEEAETIAQLEALGIAVGKRLDDEEERARQQAEAPGTARVSVPEGQVSFEKEEAQALTKARQGIVDVIALRAASLLPFWGMEEVRESFTEAMHEVTLQIADARMPEPVERAVNDWETFLAAQQARRALYTKADLLDYGVQLVREGFTVGISDIPEDTAKSILRKDAATIDPRSQRLFRGDETELKLLRSLVQPGETREDLALSILRYWEQEHFDRRFSRHHDRVAALLYADFLLKDVARRQEDMEVLARRAEAETLYEKLIRVKLTQGLPDSMIPVLQHLEHVVKDETVRPIEQILTRARDFTPPQQAPRFPPVAEEAQEVSGGFFQGAWETTKKVGLIVASAATIVASGIGGILLQPHVPSLSSSVQPSSQVVAEVVKDVVQPEAQSALVPLPVPGSPSVVVPSLEGQVSLAVTPSVSYRSETYQNAPYYVLEQEISDIPTVDIAQLRVPIEEKYKPVWPRGYFEGHYGWDIVYKAAYPGKPVPMVTPHKDALLVAGFSNLLGDNLARRLQASGDVEFYVLNVNDGTTVKPYLFFYAHLSHGSAQQAYDDAVRNNGKVTNPGFIGDTGYSNGTHMHMGVIDIQKLMEVSGAKDLPGALTFLFQDVEDIDRSMFVDPSILFPQLKQYPFLPPGETFELEAPVETRGSGGVLFGGIGLMTQLGVQESKVNVFNVLSNLRQAYERNKSRSAFQRQYKRELEVINNIKAQREAMQALPDQAAFITKTNELRSRARREGIMSVLLEAFALVREAARRTIREEPNEVQLMTAWYLMQGDVAEMRTGEGKTLSAIMAAYLAALTGEPVHIVVRDDVQARRDADKMGRVFAHLGLRTAALGDAALAGGEGAFLYQDGKLVAARRQGAYGADIVYGTYKEFSADYLRDRLVLVEDRQVQRGLGWVLVDEADQVLIDEARIPVVIAGSVPADEKNVLRVARAVRELVREDGSQGRLVEVAKGTNLPSLTEEGVAFLEQKLGGTPHQEQTSVFVEAALRAEMMFARNHDYIVEQGAVILLDPFTKRRTARRLGEGLHQAIEAKERVRQEEAALWAEKQGLPYNEKLITISPDQVTRASIPVQSFFKLYSHRAGMTGTAVQAEREFSEVYGMDVRPVPSFQHYRVMMGDSTAVSGERLDMPDRLFVTREAKYQAIVRDVLKMHRSGRPILIGTQSDEESNKLFELLKLVGIDAQLLNAGNEHLEGEVFGNAGQRGTVTVATQIAGRGIDIKLGQGVTALGGLHVIGVGRSQEKRIDEQLRGRAARLGEPGSSQFYVSLEDDGVVQFGNIGKLRTLLDAVVGDEISGPWYPFALAIIDTAQQASGRAQQEARIAFARAEDGDISTFRLSHSIKNAREQFYAQRAKVLTASDPQAVLAGVLDQEIQVPNSMLLPDEDTEKRAYAATKRVFDIADMLRATETIEEFIVANKEIIARIVNEEFIGISDEVEFAPIVRPAFERKLGLLHARQAREKLLREEEAPLYRQKLLTIMDEEWSQYLVDVEALRTSLILEAYARTDVQVAFQSMAYDRYLFMLFRIQRRFADGILATDIQPLKQQREILQRAVTLSGLRAFVAADVGSGGSGSGGDREGFQPVHPDELGAIEAWTGRRMPPRYDWQEAAIREIARIVNTQQHFDLGILRAYLMGIFTSNRFLQPMTDEDWDAAVDDIRGLYEKARRMYEERNRKRIDALGEVVTQGLTDQRRETGGGGAAVEAPAHPQTLREIIGRAILTAILPVVPPTNPFVGDQTFASVATRAFFPIVGYIPPLGMPSPAVSVPKPLPHEREETEAQRQAREAREAIAAERERMRKAISQITVTSEALYRMFLEKLRTRRLVDEENQFIDDLVTKNGELTPFGQRIADTLFVTALQHSETRFNILSYLNTLDDVLQQNAFVSSEMRRALFTRALERLDELEVHATSFLLTTLSDTPSPWMRVVDAMARERGIHLGDDTTKRAFAMAFSYPMAKAIVEARETLRESARVVLGVGVQTPEFEAALVELEANLLGDENILRYLHDIASPDALNKPTIQEYVKSIYGLGTRLPDVQRDRFIRNIEAIVELYETQRGTTTIRDDAITQAAKVARGRVAARVKERKGPSVNPYKLAALAIVSGLAAVQGIEIAQFMAETDTSLSDIASDVAFVYDLLINQERVSAPAPQTGEPASIQPAWIEGNIRSEVVDTTIYISVPPTVIPDLTEEERQIVTTVELSDGTKYETYVDPSTLTQEKIAFLVQRFPQYALLTDNVFKGAIRTHYESQQLPDLPPEDIVVPRSLASFDENGVPEELREKIHPNLLDSFRFVRQIGYTCNASAFTASVNTILQQQGKPLYNIWLLTDMLNPDPKPLTNSSIGVNGMGVYELDRRYMRDSLGVDVRVSDPSEFLGEKLESIPLPNAVLKHLLEKNGVTNVDWQTIQQIVDELEHGKESPLLAQVMQSTEEYQMKNVRNKIVNIIRTAGVDENGIPRRPTVRDYEGISDPEKIKTFVEYLNKGMDQGHIFELHSRVSYLHNSSHQMNILGAYYEEGKDGVPGQYYLVISEPNFGKEFPMMIDAGWKKVYGSVMIVPLNELTLRMFYGIREYYPVNPDEIGSMDVLVNLYAQNPEDSTDTRFVGEDSYHIEMTRNTIEVMFSDGKTQTVTPPEGYTIDQVRFDTFLRRLTVGFNQWEPFADGKKGAWVPFTIDQKFDAYFPDSYLEPIVLSDQYDRKNLTGEQITDDIKVNNDRYRVMIEGMAEEDVRKLDERLLASVQRLGNFQETSSIRDQAARY